MINVPVKKVGEKFNKKFTSHSFRKGYITHLWKNLKDIKLVCDLIGHSSVCTTERYIERLTEDEKATKIEQVTYEDQQTGKRKL